VSVGPELNRRGVQGWEWRALCAEGGVGGVVWGGDAGAVNQGQNSASVLEKSTGGGKKKLWKVTYQAIKNPEEDWGSLLKVAINSGTRRLTGFVSFLKTHSRKWGSG